MSRTSLEREIARMIEAEGPMPLSRFMALALGHPRHGYYMTRDPFGAKGDFTTAPEISQMFGEMLGVWAMSQWQAMGAPAEFHLIELGPGRGTLMMDLLRAARVMPDFLAAAHLHLIEMSPTLRAAQARMLEAAALKPQWHADVDDVPEGPSLIIANEFFDALPIRQIERTAHGFFERAVGLDANGALCLGLLPMAVSVPDHALAGEPGAIVELAEAAADYAARIARRFAAHPGAMLIIDYGHGKSATGDTLQAVRRHEKAGVLERPGETDITAHVDFEALARAFRAGGAQAYGLLSQQELLRRLGIETRAQMLSMNAGARERADVVAALGRLVGPHQMGQLFKAMAVVSSGLAAPAAFSEPFP